MAASHATTGSNGRCDVVLASSRQNRAELLALLNQHKSELQRRFDVRTLALFGSMARDRPHSKSDIDLLVEFNGVATSAHYFGLQFFLEDLLQAPVDLVTERALRPELRRFVERDAIDVRCDDAA